MSAIAGPVIDAIEGALAGAGSAGGGQEAQNVFNSDISDIVGELAHGTLFIFGQVLGAWKWSQSRAQQVGKDFETIQAANQAAGKHLRDVILPHSLSYLSGEIYRKGINPLRADVTTLQRQVKEIVAWESDIKSWRKNTVDPAISRFNGFIATFTKTYEPPIKTLIGWLAHPGTFGKWAAPYIIAPLVGDLGQDAYTAPRDALAVMLVRSWSDDVNPVWDAVLQWVVADK